MRNCENYKHLSQDSWSLEMNLGHMKYETELWKV